MNNDLLCCENVMAFRLEAAVQVQLTLDGYLFLLEPEWSRRALHTVFFLPKMTKHQCLSSRSCSSVSYTSGYLARASSLLPNRRVRTHQCSHGRWQSLYEQRMLWLPIHVCLSCQQDCSISLWIWEAVGQQSLYSLAEAAAGNSTVFVTTISRGIVWTLVLVAFRIENWTVDCGDLLTLKCRDDFCNLGLSV